MAFTTKIAGSFNSPTYTIEEKLQLAKVMLMQRAGLDSDIDAVIGSIDNDIIQTFVRDTYAQRKLIIGTNEDDVLKIDDTKSKILLNDGDDIIQSGKGTNTFYFRVGDGSDTISDAGGLDKLVFDEGINREDVIVQFNRNSDLVIALKEDGKTFDELSDKVLIVDWIKSANRVEVIEFGDGERLKLKEILEQYEATDNSESIQLSTGNDVIEAKGGNDVIKALMGNDTIIGGTGDDRLEGGVGNDTYIFNRGDGKDTIVDSSGHDTLQFTSGITNDDLIVNL